jgi:hypothetical protein
MIKKCLAAIFMSLGIFGCVSQIVSLDEHTRSWIGHPISEMKEVMARPRSYASRITWKEKIYHLDNGNYVFVEPEPRCFIHWEVDKEDIIVGYKTVGECQN